MTNPASSHEKHPESAPKAASLARELAAWVAPGARPPLVLAEPAALALANRENIRRHPEPMAPGKSLDVSRRSFIHVGHYHDAALEILRFPVVGCVMHGAADYRIADFVLGLEQGSIFVLPPGVAGPDGSRPHWERPDLQNACSETLWLIPMPSGAIIGGCRVDKGVHLATMPQVFVPDDRLLPLADMLIEELRLTPLVPGEAAYALLRALVLRLCRSLEKSLPRLLLAPDESLEAVAPVVRRVLDFIDGNLHQSMSLARLAAVAHLSVPHLQRLFTTEVGMSLMQYVTVRRMEQARQLLTQTTLPTASVGRLVGYTHPGHFGRVFRRQTGMTPGEYREKMKK